MTVKDNHLFGNESCKSKSHGKTYMQLCQFFSGKNLLVYNLIQNNSIIFCVFRSITWKSKTAYTQTANTQIKWLLFNATLH